MTDDLEVEVDDDQLSKFWADASRSGCMVASFALGGEPNRLLLISAAGSEGCQEVTFDQLKTDVRSPRSTRIVFQRFFDLETRSWHLWARKPP